MRRIKEVLRLRFEAGLGHRQIARSCSLGVGTVHDYLKRADAAGLKWPLPEDWNDEHLEAALAANGKPVRAARRALPDFKNIREQLQQHSHLTLQLIWSEYREHQADGYGYSQFCELYQRWRAKQDVVLRQDHKAGERLFVDWAGTAIPVHNADTGEVWQAPLFVAVLGASSYTYVEATRNQQLDAWIETQIHALEYFRGVPRLIVPDNTKTGVIKACRYDPDVNPTYQEMAMHYGFGVLPTRPYKPRDKAKAESGVQLAQRWIGAALRHRKFFRLADLNDAIRELLERLNNRPFAKREGTRASLFEELDRPALRPLPVSRFDLGQWSKARVNIDYHVAFDTNFYSVPYHLVHEAVEIRSAATTVEIFHRGQRVASHLRGRGHEKAVTQDGHRPKSHQAHLEWTPSRMVNWAATIGPNTAQLFERILADKPHPEMGYRSCLGIIRLADRYSAARVESAAKLAVHTGACRYKSVQSILKNSLDLQPLPDVANDSGPRPAHDNVRGAEYFG